VALNLPEDELFRDTPTQENTKIVLNLIGAEATIKTDVVKPVE
jgi:hypothetical protein